MCSQDRLRRALEDIDTVVHAAALKQVPAAEYNPMEFVKTNVLGAENLVQACIDTSVKRVVALSTDKAALRLIFMVLLSFALINYLLPLITLRVDAIYSFLLCVTAIWVHVVL